MRILYLLFSLLFLALQVSPGKMKEELKGRITTGLWGRVCRPAL